MATKSDEARTLNEANRQVREALRDLTAPKSCGGGCMDYKDAYDGEFYLARRKRTLASAKRILRIVHQLVPFRSVADFGCGTGTWLSVALDDFEADGAIGLEGDWMRAEWLDDARIELRNLDLEQPASVEPVDLAISLEVAEHVSAARAEGLVADLCATAPAVLFGAAIPGQGGVGHVNERWQSYWAGLFACHGWECYDAVRPLVWNDRDLPYWYRQNTLLYSREPLDAPRPTMLDLVHPDKWLEETGVRLRTRVKNAAKWKLKTFLLNH
jgi:hypothetical protein